VYIKINSIEVIAIKNIISKLYARLNGIGLITEDIPSTKSTLKTFEPTMFPTTKSSFFFSAARIETISSGREEPIERIVAETKNSER